MWGADSVYKNNLNYQMDNVDSIRDEKGDIKVELQILNFHLDKFPFTLANVYSRDWTSGITDQLSSILDIEHKDCVITGDFNAHNPAWGSARTDRQGEVIWDWAETKNQVLLNDGSPTRVGQGLTCIDLTFTSPKFAALADWGVMLDTWGSDHFPIITSIQIGKPTEPEIKSDGKLNFKKADWEMFKRLCEGIDPDEVYSDDPDIHCQQLTDRFLSIAGETIPTLRPRPKNKKHVPWWNKKCKDAVTGRKKALNAMKRNPCPQNYQAYREAERSAKQVILEAKRLNWEEFCKSCSIQKNTATDFWKKIKKMKGNNFSPIPFLINNIASAVKPVEKANLLVNHYKDVSSDSNIDKDVLDYQKKFESHNKDEINNPGENRSPLNDSFSISELQDIIHTRSNSATGKDRISYVLFKNMPISALKLWIKLYNQIWSKGE